jgi:Zn-dependent protease
VEAGLDGDFLQGAIFRFLALLPALTLHEFAHAWTAVRAGDPTPQYEGRVSLNPLAHLDLFGTLMILFGPIGWAKPVHVNPTNFRHPSRDIVVTSAAGPISNLIQGTFWALVLRTVIAAGVQHDLLLGFLALLTLINFVLAVFNLIPLGPLDGHEILAYFLPYRLERVYRQLNQYGFAILLGLILISFFTRIPILSVVIVMPAGIAGSFVSGQNIFSLIYDARMF